MKIRSNHVTAAVLVLVAAFIGAAYYRSQHLPTPAAVPSAPTDDPFLKEAHALQARTSEEQGVGALPPITNPDAIPMIEVETLHLDLGVISHKEIAHTKLSVMNKGKGTLKLSDIRTSCACTQGVIPPQYAALAAGQKGFIEVSIDPFRIPGFHSQKTLTIMSGDPSKPALDVKVSATVDPEFDLVPDELDFGDVQKGETPEKTFLVRQHGDEPFELKGAEEAGAEEASKQGALRVSYEKIPESEWATPGKVEYRVKVGLEPLIGPGTFDNRVVLQTTTERLPKMWYHVKGAVKACYQVMPVYPKPLLIKRDTPMIAMISADQPIEIADIEAPAIFAVTPKPTDDPKKVNLVVSLVGDSQGRTEEDVRFTVKAGDNAYPERIRVKAFGK
jgi:hypothetical protein